MPDTGLYSSVLYCSPCFLLYMKTLFPKNMLLKARPYGARSEIAQGPEFLDILTELDYKGILRKDGSTLGVREL